MCGSTTSWPASPAVYALHPNARTPSVSRTGCQVRLPGPGIDSSWSRWTIFGGSGIDGHGESARDAVPATAGAGAFAGTVPACSARERPVSPRAVTDPSQPLREEDVDPDPVRQFDRLVRGGASAPASASPRPRRSPPPPPDGAPSVRMVLVKQAGPDGFVFFTNYESRKGARARRQPARGAAVPLGAARAPGADRGPGGAHHARGVRGLCAQPAARAAS